MIGPECNPRSRGRLRSTIQKGAAALLHLDVSPKTSVLSFMLTAILTAAPATMPAAGLPAYYAAHTNFLSGRSCLAQSLRPVAGTSVEALLPDDPRRSC